MTKQEIIDKINAGIRGQGSQVDTGGVLGEILEGIMEMAEEGGGGAGVLDIGMTLTPDAGGFVANFASAPDFEAMKTASAVKVIVDASTLQPGLVVEEFLSVFVAANIGNGAAESVIVGDTATQQDIPMGFEFGFQNGNLIQLFGPGHNAIEFTIGD